MENKIIDINFEKVTLNEIILDEHVIENKNYDKKSKQSKKKIFYMFSIRDIAFIAIISAVMLVTGAVMPLANKLHIYGMPQLFLSLQFSILPAICLFKVRKIGTLFLISIFTGVVLVFMAPVMIVNNLITSLILELLALIIFRGYKKNKGIYFVSSSYLPLSLPIVYLYDFLVLGKKSADILYNRIDLPIYVSLGVICLTIIGSIIGGLIAKELNKAGVLKPNVLE